MTLLEKLINAIDGLPAACWDFNLDPDVVKEKIRAVMEEHLGEKLRAPGDQEGTPA